MQPKTADMAVAEARDYDCFVINNAPSSAANIHKLMYSFLCSVHDSDNLLVHSTLHDYLHCQIPLFQRRHSVLH